MNEAKSRTEITNRTRVLTIFRTGYNDKSNFVYCRNCRKPVTGFRRSHAALIFRADLPELDFLRQQTYIHTAENGVLCGAALAEYFNREILYVED